MLLNILLGILLVVGVAMIGAILLQRSEGGGLVSGGGGALMSARGASNLLTKTTQILAAIFFGLALLITILTGREASSSSLTRAIKGKSIDASTLNKSLAPPAAPLPTTAPATPGQAPAGGAPVPFGLPPASK